MSQILCLKKKINVNENIVNPHEFLEWANLDLKESDNRARGNALGNIKKSIHCRIDEIIYETNITFGKNWDAHINTYQKLEILKDIEIKYMAVVQLITDERNRFEHDYSLPDIGKLKAFYDSADLWIDKSYRSYNFNRIGIVLKSDKVILDANYKVLEKCNFEYYWFAKKEIHDCKDGILSITKYSETVWEDLLKYQKKHYKNMIDQDPLFALDQTALTMIYKRLRKFNNIDV